MQVFWNEKHDHIEISLPLLMDASFCAASGMIAFGAVIGKSSPTQLMWLLFLQVL
jgi:ammonium transporter Rh